jgi:FixJ family two-component response regulator
MSAYTLLVVDDEPNVLKAIRRLFAGADYDILTAESGEAGLRFFESHTFHLVISDYRMPGMNGVQFLSKVKELYPETIRIILSGYADVAAIVEAINDGQIYKFLAKPWNDQELLTAVRRSCEHFSLQREHYHLLEELRTANSELKLLTRGLEQEIEERTRVLHQKNRALELTHNILNFLPIGVLGTDAQEIVVYLNQALPQHLGTANIGLGQSMGGAAGEAVTRTMQEAMRLQEVKWTALREPEEVGVICRPLPERTGLITLFVYRDLGKYGGGAEKITENTEVPDVR